MTRGWDSTAPRNLAAISPSNSRSRFFVKFEWPGGSPSVKATVRSCTLAGSGAMRQGRVLSRNRPATPDRMNRSCQRHTVTLPGARLAHDLVGAQPGRRQQHDPRAAHLLLPAAAVGDDRLQSPPVGRTRLDCDTLAHAAPLPGSDHTPFRTLLSGLYHSHVRFPSSRQPNWWLSFARLFWTVLGRAGGAAVKATVDHTLMRGSEPHDR